MEMRSFIFKNDYLAFTESGHSEKGISIHTHDFKMFLECTVEDAEILAKELLESVKRHKEKGNQP